MSILLDNKSQSVSVQLLDDDCFRSVLDRIDVGVLLLQLNPQSGSGPLISYANDTLLDWSGFGSKNILGLPLSNIFGSKKLRVLVERLYAIIQSGGVYEFTNNLKCLNGSELECSWQVSCIYDEDGVATNFLLTVYRNVNKSSGVSLVNERVERKYRGNLEFTSHSKKMEILAMQAGGIAHDFKNMLTTVVANLSLISDSIHDPEILSKLNDAMKASKEAADLAAHMLTYSRGSDECKKEEVDISQLLKDAARLCTAGSKTRCDVDVQIGVWLSCVNSIQILQVINNLIINARHAMDDEGVIKANLDNTELQNGDIQGLNAGKYLKLVFIDHGRGISKNNISEIFKRFYTTKKTGSGLGLATCLSIVRDHGGTIKVNSVEGKGSVFTVYLPAIESSSVRSKEVNEEVIKQGKGRVLVVDDDERILKVSTSMLQNLGYEVEVACSGQEGVEKFRRSYNVGNAFEVILMDMTMPGGLDGVEASQELLNIDMKAKIISSSGYNTDDSLELIDGRDLFSGILSKPYDLEKMSSMVKAVLDSD